MTNLLDEIVVIAPSLLFGAFVGGSVGFGIGLVAFPFILLIVAPKTAVVVVNTVSMVVFALLVFQNRNKIKYKEMRIPILAGILGVPVGVIFLDQINTSTLNVVIAVLIIGSAVFTTFLENKNLGTGPHFFILVSFLVGILTVGTGIGGPLMAVAAVAKNWERDTIRGSIPLYYICIKGFAVVGYFATQRFDLEILTLTVVGVIPTVIGFALASAFIGRIQEGLYRKLILVIIIVAGTNILVRAVLQLT